MMRVAVGASITAAKRASRFLKGSPGGHGLGVFGNNSTFPGTIYDPFVRRFHALGTGQNVRRLQAMVKVHRGLHSTGGT
jgi:hypothetical protein